MHDLKNVWSNKSLHVGFSIYLLWILLLLLVENCILIHFLLAINNTNNTVFAMAVGVKPAKCIAVCIVTWFTQSQTKFHSFAILLTQCSSVHDSRSLKRKHWDRQSASDCVCSCWLHSCLRRRTVTQGQCLQEVFVVDEIPQVVIGVRFNTTFNLQFWFRHCWS